MTSVFDLAPVSIRACCTSASSRSSVVLMHINMHDLYAVLNASRLRISRSGKIAGADALRWSSEWRRRQCKADVPPVRFLPCALAWTSGWGILGPSCRGRAA